MSRERAQKKPTLPAPLNSVFSATQSMVFVVIALANEQFMFFKNRIQASAPRNISTQEMIKEVSLKGFLV